MFDDAVDVADQSRTSGVLGGGNAGVSSDDNTLRCLLRNLRALLGH